MTDRCSSGPSHRQPQGLGSSVPGPGKRNKHPKVLCPRALLHRAALPDPDAREPKFLREHCFVSIGRNAHSQRARLGWEERARVWSVFWGSVCVLQECPEA